MIFVSFTPCFSLSFFPHCNFITIRDWLVLYGVNVPKNSKVNSVVFIVVKSCEWYHELMTLRNDDNDDNSKKSQMNNDNYRWLVLPKACYYWLLYTYPQLIFISNSYIRVPFAGLTSSMGDVRFYMIFFHEHSRITRQRGEGKAIF